jgi:hypothetical protein
MQNDLSKTNELALYDLTELLQVAVNQVWPADDTRSERPPAYRLASRWARNRFSSASWSVAFCYTWRAGHTMPLLAAISPTR